MSDVPATVTAAKPPRRFRFRFGLRTLLILGPLLTIAAAIGFRMWYVDYLQSWAIEQIARQGGTIVRNSEQEVVTVEFPGLAIDDEKLKTLTPALAALPKLETLVLASNAVTDEGLQQLGELKRLKVVYLADTKVTEQGVAKLKQQRPDLNVEMTPPHLKAMKLASRPIYQHAILSLALAPDGTLISGSGDGRLRLWDVRREKMAAEFEAHREWAFGIARLPGSQVVATAGGDHVVRLWNWKTGRVAGVLRGHDDDVHGLAVTPDGKTLVTTGDDVTVRIWDIATRKLRHTLYGHDDTIPAVAINATGTLAASASRDHTIRLWDIGTGEHRGTLEGHTDDVMSVEFHPHKNELVTASYDGTVKLWNLESRQVTRTLSGHKGWAFASRYSPDAAQLVSTAADGVRLWDTATSKLLWHAEDQRDVAAALWLDRSRVATASADGSIRVYRKDGELLATLWTQFSGELRAEQLRFAGR